jgi:hypothetical protein
VYRPVLVGTNNATRKKTVKREEVNMCKKGEMMNMFWKEIE